MMRTTHNYPTQHLGPTLAIASLGLSVGLIVGVKYHVNGAELIFPPTGAGPGQGDASSQEYS
jgi:hypothetical protein